MNGSGGEVQRFRRRPRPVYRYIGLPAAWLSRMRSRSRWLKKMPRLIHGCAFAPVTVNGDAVGSAATELLDQLAVVDLPLTVQGSTIGSAAAAAGPSRPCVRKLRDPDAEATATQASARARSRTRARPSEEQRPKNWLAAHTLQPQPSGHRRRRACSRRRCGGCRARALAAAISSQSWSSARVGCWRPPRARRAAAAAAS